MKMVLTRLGEDSQLVVTGDPGQSDLPGGRPEGLAEALAILDGVEGVGIQRFSDADVVRHALVSRIIRAYTDRGK
jgi:phosphate starvation-inducible PhoH-like protein